MSAPTGTWVFLAFVRMLVDPEMMSGPVLSPNTWQANDPQPFRVANAAHDLHRVPRYLANNRPLRTSLQEDRLDPQARAGETKNSDLWGFTPNRGVIECSWRFRGTHRWSSLCQSQLSRTENHVECANVEAKTERKQHTQKSKTDAISQAENASVAAQPQLVYQDTVKTPTEKTGTKAFAARLRRGPIPQIPTEDFKFFYHPNAGINMAAFTKRELRATLLDSSSLVESSTQGDLTRTNLAWDMGRTSKSVLIHFLSDTFPDSVKFFGSVESTPSGPKWRLVRIADRRGIEETSAWNQCARIASTAGSNNRPISSAPPLALPAADLTKPVTDFAAVDTNVARPSGEGIPHHISPR
ncbi:hypothetical protein HPB51_015409 [Rhipicephalus microplus]|uniref:Uncharacterized protein n=1 Tax=Rhipicephalus microplus TaxID=6941 RepID=A0A9J6DVD9_RHIMP|nr:hypothetical protein HPB51_015409 [Rhipicephalus microplus]